MKNKNQYRFYYHADKQIVKNLYNLQSPDVRIGNIKAFAGKRMAFSFDNFAPKINFHLKIIFELDSFTALKI